MASTINASTQYQIDVEDVIDNIILQKDGSCSLVIKTNAVNFGLLSEEEQDATIYTYAAFLNSLTFSVQILIRSDIKDISGYLKLLEEQEIKQLNPIKKAQINQYKSFISSLIKERNVLEKSFYIIIPFSTLELGAAQSMTASFLSPKKTLPFEKSYIIQKARAVLEPKRDHVIRQISRIGVSAYQLNTQELIQLLFSMYNASSSQGQKITNTQEYTVPLVQPAYIKPKEDSMDVTSTPATPPVNTAATPPPAAPTTTELPTTTPAPVVQPPVAPAVTPAPTPLSPIPAVAPTMSEPAPVSPTPPSLSVSPDLIASTPTPTVDTPAAAPLSPAPEPAAHPTTTHEAAVAPTITPGVAPITPAPTPEAPTISLDEAQEAINNAAVNLTGSTDPVA